VLGLAQAEGYGWDILGVPSVVAESGQLVLLGAGAAVCRVQCPCFVAAVEVEQPKTSRIGGGRKKGRVRVPLVKEVEEAGKVALQDVVARDLAALDDGRVRTTEGPARVVPVAAWVSAGIAGALVSLGPAERLLDLLGGLVGGAIVEIKVL
jgi:hypothetical protein